MKLSIVIPAYNESKTLKELVNKVIQVELPPNFQKEIIIVNDCSTDDTLAISTELANIYSEITAISNPINLGKSQTVKHGIIKSTGDWVVIQDADLEYDPEDFAFILEQVIKHNCDVGYGNRFGLDNGIIYIQNFIGNVTLSTFSNLFTMWNNHVFIPDMEVCYKLIRGDVARELGATIESKSNFGFEPEITAKLSKYRKKEGGGFLKFVILPIRYYPRSIQEGKKMKAFQDGFKALIEIIKFNIK